MKIPLAEMARATGTRRKRVFLREIAPTQALETALFVIYLDGLRVWNDLARTLVVEYAPPPKALVTDADDGRQLQWMVDQAAQKAENTILYQTEKLGQWVARVGTWNGEKTISTVKSATGVDVRPFVRLSDVQPILGDSIRANVSLMRNLNAATRSKVENILYDGLVNRRSKKHVTDALAEAMDTTKKRARFIANDQTEKLNIALTSYRNQELGIEQFKWKHTPQKHPRANHVVRDNKLFRWDAPPSDGLPGYLPNCKCRAQPMLEIEDGTQGG